MAPRHPNDGKQLNFCIRYNLEKKKKMRLWPKDYFHIITTVTPESLYIYELQKKI